MRSAAGRQVQGRGRGIAATELAVLLPFLSAIFVLAIDYARVFYATVVVANCARNGAVYASNIANYPGWEGQATTYASIQQAALADAGGLSPAITASNVAVTSSSQDGNSLITVTVTYTFTTVTNFPLLPSSITIQRSIQTRVAPAAPG
jgi:hypothetical protein